MINRLKYLLVGLAAAMLAAGVLNHFFEFGFWQSTLLVMLGMFVNGVIADWEDRGKFND